MTDLHALSGAYALDALSDADRNAFDEHLSECSDCLVEVSQMTETASLLSLMTESEPSAGARATLLAALADTPQLAPVAEVVSISERRGHRAAPATSTRRRWTVRLGSLAAAAAVAAAITFTSVQMMDTPDSTQPSLVAAVLADPEATEITLEFDGSHEAKVVQSDELGRAVMVGGSMPALPEGSSYQLWFQTPEGDMVSAGVLPKELSEPMLLEGDSRPATAIGVTVEPEGGSEAPSGDPVALAPLS